MNRSVEGMRRGRGDPPLTWYHAALRRRVSPDRGGLGDGLATATMGTTSGSKIAGGFVLVNVAALMTAWRACQARPLGIGDFRAWLACHELQARRCTVDDDRAPAYSNVELARLLGVTDRRARASVRRLEAAGLIEWSGEVIGFSVSTGLPEGVGDTISGGKGNLVIPRRMIRFLAGGARAALIATMLALLLRCLSRRKEGFDGRGRVKASWIGRVFGVDLRRVKAARIELVALGWIESEPADQRAMNRWGRAYRINLAWERVETGGRVCHPLRKSSGPRLPPPQLTRNPFGREFKTRNPPACRLVFQSQSQGSNTSRYRLMPIRFRPVSSRFQACRLPPSAMSGSRI